MNSLGVKVVVKFLILFAALLCSSKSEAFAENVDEGWEAGAMAASPRLFLYTLLRDKPIGSSSIIESLFEGQGLINSQNKKVTKLAIKPNLAYDQNINGGLTSDTYSVGPFIFEVDEDSKSKSGALVGATSVGSLTYNFGTGRVLAINGTATWQYSPEFRISRSEISLRGCLRQYSGDWQFLDFCVGGYRNERVLSVNTGEFINVTATKLFNVGKSSNQLGFTLVHEWKDRFDRTKLEIGLLTALPRVGAVSINVSFGQKIQGTQTEVLRLNSSLSRPFFGKTTSISIDYSRETGGAFFGTDRTDEVLKFGVVTRLYKSSKVTLGWEKRKSTISDFDTSGLVFGVSFGEIEF